METKPSNLATQTGLPSNANLYLLRSMKEANSEYDIFQIF